MSEENLIRAIAFCKSGHDSIKQVRKYTGEPYWNHPIEVMEIVKTVQHTEVMLIAALFHDLVEDTSVTLSQIEIEFGKDVACLVEMLTDVSRQEDGNRAIRKNIDLQHTAKASPEAKTIKLADLISNSRSIVEHDIHFARLYLKEKALLLNVLTEGDKDLYDRAFKLLQESEMKLLKLKI